MDDKREKEVLGEAMHSDIKAIREGMGMLLADVPEIKADLKDVKARVERLEDKVSAIPEMNERLTRVEHKVDVIGDSVKDHTTDIAALKSER